MIIYEVSTNEHDHYGYCQYYTDRKFYLLRENEGSLSPCWECGETPAQYENYYGLSFCGKCEVAGARENEND